MRDNQRLLYPGNCAVERIGTKTHFGCQLALLIGLNGPKTSLQCQWPNPAAGHLSGHFDLELFQ